MSWDVSDYPWVGIPSLARTAGRFPTGGFADQLARLATKGQMGAAELRAHVRNDDRGRSPSLHPKLLAWFGYALASRVESEGHAAEAVRFFDLAYRLGGRQVFSEVMDFVWVEATSLAGRFPEFEDVLAGSTASAESLWAARTDELHPGAANLDVADEWLRSFNEPIVAAGLEPVVLDGDADSPFDRLSASAPPVRTADVPLVSVVMPVYNPGRSLVTAVRSVLRQTWQNLEVLLCDDASTSGHEYLDQLAAEDARVRVVRARANGGAYAARNMGLGVARGEYVTFNDADDWSHPRRVERQLLALTTTPTARATVSHSIRATGELHLTVMGRPPRRVNLSSIMFPRREVMERLGSFDAVRRGADSEFVERFRAVLGNGAIHEVEEPLALVQLTAGSLSRDDYRFLRIHPARPQYVADFRRWHQRIAAGLDSGYLAPGTRIPSPAPARIRGTAPDRHDVDVVILGNFGVESPTTLDITAEVDSLTAMGMTVGLVEFLGPFDLTGRIRLAAGRLADHIRSGHAARVLPGDPCRARLALLRDPAAAETMPVESWRDLDAGRVVVVADYRPAGRYDVSGVADRIAAETGAPVYWLPATEEIAAELRAELPAYVVLAPQLFGRIDSPARLAADIGSGPRRLGLAPGSTRGAPNAELYAALDPCVPRNPERPVVVWDTTRPAKVLGIDVLDLSANDMQVEDFLSRVDVVSAPLAHGRGAHLNPVVVRAMAHGKVVVVDPEFRGHLGAGAWYLDDGAIDGRLAELENGAVYREQAQRGLDFVSRHFGDAAFERVVTSLLALSTEVGKG